MKMEEQDRLARKAEADFERRRQRCGRTTAALARLVDRAQAVLDRFEGRTRGKPSADTLGRMLRAAIRDARALVRAAERTFK